MPKVPFDLNLPTPYFILVDCFDAVLVKVPAAGSRNFKFIPAHRLRNKQVTVARHWRAGYRLREEPLRGQVFYQRNFYGLDEKDFGNFILAKVEVIYKANQAGLRSLLLDITKYPEKTAAGSIKSKFELIPPTRIRPRGRVVGFEIFNTGRSVYFIRTK